MTGEKLEYFKRILTERLNELSEETVRTRNHIMVAEENYPDLVDQANALNDQEFFMRINDRDWKLIVKIREALGRVDSGAFGLCDECGEEISEERLRARPFTTLCFDCKALREEQERRMVMPQSGTRRGQPSAKRAPHRLQHGR